MKFLTTIVSSFIFQVGFSQYEQVPLTKAESKSGILRHYEIADKYASVHLFILPGKKFRFENYTCITNNYSEGNYRETENEIIFTSTLQKGTLPVQVQYRRRDLGDSLIKRIALIQNADGKELTDGILYINDDSTSCIYGDNFCSKELSSIDSIKVVLPGEASSAWIKIKADNGIIQIRIPISGELEKYIIFNQRFRKDGRTLEPIFE